MSRKYLYYEFGRDPHAFIALKNEQSFTWAETFKDMPPLTDDDYNRPNFFVGLYNRIMNYFRRYKQFK